MSICEEDARMEQIKGAMAGLPDEVIRDALVLSLTETAVHGVTAEEKNLETEKFHDIFELVTYLKRTYQFPELDLFLMEGGRLLFKDGDRRIVISEKPTEKRSVPERPFVGNNPSIKRNTEIDRLSSGNGRERFSRLELDD